MTIKSYQDLEVWQKAMGLAMECYKVTKEFPKSETYGLCNQLQRAAMSIPANIAEGRGRQYTKEFLKHLSIAYGSLAELETYILLAKRLNYIQNNKVEWIMSKTAELGRMINGLQRSLRGRGQGSGVRDQGSGVRDQGSGIRGQGSGVRDQGSEVKQPTPDPRPPTPEKGFSLVELLIAMALASFVGLAGYTIFSTSNWSYKVQEDISEAQQNVRVAMDRLAKDIRVAGFGLPEESFSLSFSNLSTTPPTLPNPITAPITTTNSSTGNDTITILGIGYEAGTLMKGSATDCNDSGKGKICLDSVASANNFFTGSGPYTYQPNRRYISLNGTKFIELANTQTDTDRSAGKLALGSPATLDRDYPDGTPVYIIQAVQYTLATDLTGCSATNPCLVSRDYTMLRGGSTPGERQVLTENIEDIQFAYGIDSDGDGDVDSYSDDPADPSTIMAVRANIVAKTRNQDSRGATFSMKCLEDRSTDANCTGAPTDSYRRRVLTKIIKLRNPRTEA